MPYRPKPEGPFKLRELQQKVRDRVPLTPEEREFHKAYYRSYEPGRFNIRTRPEYVDEWTKAADERGMSRSEWVEERVLISLRPEGPEVAELRKSNQKLAAERDMMQSQMGEMALKLSNEQQRARETERTVNRLLAEEIRRRGGA